ncbi:TPA: helix-turn-helix transcriptional regulator, partial [Clostridioides difficile]|nr:helix-turn-helix transcriptional regulator [Clostridioides difficile]
MSIKERRKNEKEEMKKKIMDASIEIINQHGYENLSIRKIATKIEYSPTTIY